MALKPQNKTHLNQIRAGINGRKNGHTFEKDINDEINKLNYAETRLMTVQESNNIYIGNPAQALLNHISSIKKKRIILAKSDWLGGLATAGLGSKIKNKSGEDITGSKSDIIVTITYDDNSTETIGISIKSCKNNAQINLTTSSAFCNLLRSENIGISDDAETALKMFCGEPGFSPKDGYLPKDCSNISIERKARPERWFWEELPNTAKDEWKEVFNINQKNITMLLLQRANAYKTDYFRPEFILHECQAHESINSCHLSITSVEELANYSLAFDGFGIKSQQIKKGKYKGIDLAIHQYPHFGFIQFQPIGNKQNFSELQFNLKSNYYNQFAKLKESVYTK